MKTLYYRSQKISNRALIAIAMSTFAALVLLNAWPHKVDLATREVMLDAAYRAEASFEAILCRRVDMNHKMLRLHDPAGTGMLGPSMSMVTTLPGHLDAKQTSVNPNFAAVAVKLLVDAGVKSGDRVAIGMTGSFPALNIAVLQACEAMQLRPSIVSSAAASQFGANDPEMMWPDMEHILFHDGLISHRSLATSLGGFRDSADGMSDDTRVLLENAITRNGCLVLTSTGLNDAVQKRMNMLYEDAKGEPFAAYVNVGGGAASVGGTDGNDLWGNGVIAADKLDELQRSVADVNDLNCVATRFLKSKTPFINLINAVALAERYHLAVAPHERQLVGKSNVYQFRTHRQSLAALGVLIILTATWLAVRPPRRLVLRLRRRGWWKNADDQPQWMV